MKKKIFAALLSATMVMSMMTGCGSEPDQPADNTVEQSTEESSAEPSSVEESTTEESSAESVEESVEEPAGGLAEAEALPDALYHFAMDGSDEGILTMIQSEDVGSNTGATYGVVESSTYVDKDGAEQPIVVQIGRAHV